MTARGDACGFAGASASGCLDGALMEVQKGPPRQDRGLLEIFENKIVKVRHALGLASGGL